MAGEIGRCGPREAWEAASRGEAQVVDVREPGEYDTERVPGSVLLPLSDLDGEASRADRSKALLVVCRTGSRAASAAERLSKLGFGKIRVVDGGLVAWAAEGLPVERGAGRVWAMERQVRFAAGGLSAAGTALGWAVHPGFLALPAFIGAGLVFSAVTDTCGMALVLARMPWNRRRSSCRS